MLLRHCERSETIRLNCLSQPMNISLKNISFSYSDSLDDAILKNLNLEIRSGECVVLAGESGCGKTTISKLINGLIPHYHSGTMDGDVQLGDKNTADMTLAEISRVVGSVFQNPRSQFFNIDTDCELAFGCENLGMDPEEIKQRVENVVQEFHLEHLLGRSIFNLSGGEKQKIACASVAATDPEIFVLDEPSEVLEISRQDRCCRGTPHPLLARNCRPDLLCKRRQHCTRMDSSGTRSERSGICGKPRTALHEFGTIARRDGSASAPT